MKRKKSVLLAVLIGFSIVMSGFNAWGLPSVSLELADNDVSVGDVFDVLVVADGIGFDSILNEGDLLAFGFDVVFDSAGFSFNSATVGPDFTDDSLLFPDTDVAGSAFPGVGGDDILLATLNFTALTDGLFSLGIFADILNDPNEGMITFSIGAIDMTQNREITVDSAGTEPVPEPSTIMLVFVGLAGMMGIRKFRK